MVEKVRHKKLGIVMARKVVKLELAPTVQKQIMSELRILYAVNSDQVVGFYGSSFEDSDLSIYMELMVWPCRVGSALHSLASVLQPTYAQASPLVLSEYTTRFLTRAASLLSIGQWVRC